MGQGANGGNGYHGGRIGQTIKASPSGCGKRNQSTKSAPGNPSQSQREGEMRKETIILEDDLDGGPADESVTFSLAGQDYVIDLSSGNADRFRGALADYIRYARKAPANGKRKPARNTDARQRSASLREWAGSHGYQVSARGRIPREIKRAYAADMDGATRPARGPQRAGDGRGATARATGKTRAARAVPAAPVHAPEAPAASQGKPGRKPGRKPGATRAKR
jgi:hypothetical protein